MQMTFASFTEIVSRCKRNTKYQQLSTQHRLSCAPRQPHQPALPQPAVELNHYKPILMPVDHYENFPVASILLPAHLRPAVEAIYAFARSADDIADEGDAQPAERLAQLENYSQQLTQLSNNPALAATAPPMFQRLSQVMQDYALPWQPLHDLLSAFKQDVVTTRYASFADVLDYCRRSANPVGCLMLHLYGKADENNLRASDDICSALQIINFWQDIAIDWQKQRVYLPQEDLLRFGVSEEMIARQDCNSAFQAMLQFQVARSKAMMLRGAPLALRLPGRIGWELRLVVQGGLQILQKIEQAHYDIFRKRPKLGAFDWFCILWRAMWMR